MRVTLKLFASLAPFLPDGAENNMIDLDLDEGTTIAQAFERYEVPRKMCHLVLVNGIFVAPRARDDHALKDGDALAAWPPVAGG